MNVREALEERTWFNEMDTEDRAAAQADIERALRAEREAGYLAGFGCANDGGLSDETAKSWAKAAGKGELTAGVAAMVEGS